MSHIKSLPTDAGPPQIYARYPEIYGPWSKMSQELMNGTSSLSQGEREVILAYAAGLSGCDFVCVAHAEVAYAWGVERGLVERLLTSNELTSSDEKLRPLLSYVRKLVVASHELSEGDAEAVFLAGWDEKALHDAIAISARAAFMQRLIEGFGFKPLPRDVVARHASKRIERGYVDLYSAFRSAKNQSEN